MATTRNPSDDKSPQSQRDEFSDAEYLEDVPPPSNTSPREMKLNEISQNSFEVAASRIYEHYLKENRELLETPLAAAQLYRLIGGANQPELKLEVRKIEKTVLCNVVPTDSSITIPEDKRQRTETGFIERPFFHVTGQIKQVAPFDDKTTQTKISEKKAPGLATLKFIAGILEHNFNKERIGYESELQQFINWDFENVFDHCAVFQNHPRDAISPYFPSQTTRFSESSIETIRETREYLEEEFTAAFKMFSVPPSVISQSINATIHNSDLAQKFCKRVTENIAREKLKYFADPRFRDFCFKNHEQLHQSFLKQLTSITKKEIDEQEYTAQTTPLSTMQNLEVYIVNNTKEFTVAQIKELIRKIRIFQIHQKDDIDAPFELADEIGSMDHFKIIRDRSGITSIDLKGNNLNGEPVGETCNQIMQAAKIHMLFNAVKRKVEKKKDDYLNKLKTQERFISFLSSQRHSSYLGFAPLFSLLGRPTSSQLIFDSLKEIEKSDDSKLSELLEKLREEDKQIYQKNLTPSI